MSVHFFNEDIKYILLGKKNHKEWISAVVAKEKFKLIAVNYIFCSDEYLHSMNKKYLNHDTLTDVITFDSSEHSAEIEGDIFISIERVKENARERKSKLIDELNRVMVHGVLHLMGYGDKTKEEVRIMREKEEAYLSLRHY